MSITVYFTGLDKFQISLIDRGISTSIEEKVMAAVALMWESEMFTEDQMVAWENRPAVDQIWTNLQTYFTRKSGWKGANTWQPQQSSHTSRKQCWQRKSKQQPQKKAKHKC